MHKEKQKKSRLPARKSCELNQITWEPSHLMFATVAMPIWRDKKRLRIRIKSAALRDSTALPVTIRMEKYAQRRVAIYA